MLEVIAPINNRCKCSSRICSAFVLLETAEAVELSIGRNDFDRGSLLVNGRLPVAYLIVHVFKFLIN